MKLIKSNKKYNSLYKYGALDLENGVARNLDDFRNFDIKKGSIIEFKVDFINGSFDMECDKRPVGQTRLEKNWYKPCCELLKKKYPSGFKYAIKIWKLVPYVRIRYKGSPIKITIKFPPEPHLIKMLP